MGLLLLTLTGVSTTCAVVIFRVKVSCITSVDGIILWLLVWLVNYVAMLLVVCQLSQGQRQTGGQTGSSVQDQKLRLPGFLHWWNRQKPKHAADRTQTSDEEWWRQQSHCWAPFTDETSNWLGLCHMYNVFYRLLSTSYFRKLVY